MENQRVKAARRVGTGLAFILAPLLFAVAFVAHPNLGSLEVGGDVSARIAEFHGNAFMHFGHFMMLLSVPLLIVAAFRFASLLDGPGAWLGFLGGIMAVFGCVILAVDKTALCLVMSAFDTLPEAKYQQMTPGIETLFRFEGYLQVLHLLVLLPLGFLLQGIGLHRAHVLPRWQTSALIVAALGLGVAAAVDIDLFGLIATGFLAVAFIPYGVGLVRMRAA